MLSNHQQRRKRLSQSNQAARLGLGYKFNQEQSSYDKIMRVLNNQQSRITNMLKKYGDDAEETSLANNINTTLASIDEPSKYFNPRTYQTISNLEEASVSSVKLSSREAHKREYGLGRDELSRRLERSMPLRKKNDLTRNMYNVYGYSEIDLPRLPQVKSLASKGKKRSRRELSVDRRSKDQIIHSLYTDKKPAKQPKKGKKPRKQENQPKRATEEDLNEDVVERASNQSESETEQEQPVPLPQYYKQFRDVVRKQTVQQMNFLYFSKNETMKNWTQSILTMFEKHDKELRMLRKRTRYLENFDQHFFTADAFVE